MTVLFFRIPQAIYLSQNGREHHMSKAKKTAALRQIGRLTARDVEPVPTPCDMHVVYGWPDHRQRDRSNAAPTVKGLLDGAVDAGVLDGDTDLHIARETYESHVEGDKGFIHITITLTPLEATQ